MPEDLIYKTSKDLEKISKLIGFDSITFVDDNSSSYEDYVVVQNKKSLLSAKKKSKKVIFSADKKTDLKEIIGLKPWCMTNLEFQDKDFIHHRAGLNQVLASEMKDNSIRYAPSLQLLFSTKYKPQVMGRIKQNILVCRKYGVKIRAFTLAKDKNSMKSYRDLVSLLMLLGLDSIYAKKAFLKED